MSGVEYPAKNVSSLPPPAPLGGVDYLMILWGQRKVIFSVIGFFIVLAVAARFLLPLRYQETVVMVPASPKSNASKGVMGTLASLGLLGGSENSNQKVVALATLQSRRFLEDFITHEHMLPVLFPDRWDAHAKRWQDTPPKLQAAYKILHSELTIDDSSTDDIVRVSVTWWDDKVAAMLVNKLVARLNMQFQAQAVARADRMIDYLRQAYQKTAIEEVRTSIANLIQEQIKTRIMAQSKPDYVMKVIDPAVPSKNRVSPGLSILLPLAVLLGGLLGTSAAFLRHSLATKGHDPFEKIFGTMKK